MGWCCLNGVWVGGYKSPQECFGDRGTEYTDQPPVGPTCGDTVETPSISIPACFVNGLVGGLGVTIQRLVPTYQYTRAFRDEILSFSPLGRRMIRLYYKYSPKASAIVMADHRLLLQSIDAWFEIFPFVATAVATSRAVGEETPPYARKVRFTKGMYRKVSEILKTFQERTDDNGFRSALSEVRKELTKYVNATASEALVRARIPLSPRRHPVRGSKHHSQADVES